MEKINVAELIKDCPKGMELDCTIFDGNVTLDYIDLEKSFPINIRLSNGHLEYLTKTGGFTHEALAKCVIFPKGKNTWEGFNRPFKDGDVIYNKGINALAIFYKQTDDCTVSHCFLNTLGELKICHHHSKDLSDWKFATEEEKPRLFQAIKDNGYRWNYETKTLEKLVEPKFKVGDKVKHKTHIRQVDVVTEIKDTYYILNDESALSFTFQDDYELVPNKFDFNTLVPFDSRVLVRHTKDNKWCASFFSHIDEDFHSHCYKFITTSGKSYPYCIPYEGNQHLLGKVDDCDEFYKIL